MIRIQYDDSVINNQLYCSFQTQREMNDGEYASLFISRWFGSAELLPPQGRGELLALAGVVGVYRHELLLISPQFDSEPDRPLKDWRDRFNRIEYCVCDLPVQKLLDLESKVLESSVERAVVYEMVIKNLFSSVFYDEPNTDGALESCESLEDASVVDFICVLVDSPSKIICFRKAFSVSHLRAIVSQANDHNLSIYYSPFEYQGKQLVAEGPWNQFPSKLRVIGESDNPSPIDLDDSIPPQFIEGGIPMSVLANTPEMTQVIQNELDNDLIASLRGDNQVSVKITDHEVVETKDGHVICPYCDRDFKKKFGLTNHIKAAHKEYYDSYRDHN